ncbi:hypothetical protein [Kiloniella sp.]|uniref:hypothetical protein n=1 Tax=Kiloniella sp. TaxID=1938587 RepID=UPI003B021D1B
MLKLDPQIFVNKIVKATAEQGYKVELTHKNGYEEDHISTSWLNGEPVWVIANALINGYHGKSAIIVILEEVLKDLFAEIDHYKKVQSELSEQLDALEEEGCDVDSQIINDRARIDLLEALLKKSHSLHHKTRALISSKDTADEELDNMMSQIRECVKVEDAA